MRIKLHGDGRGLSPAEQARALCALPDQSLLAPDSYGEGGAVSRLERKMARLLGKSAAVLLPTGIMANLLALRALCGARRRAVAVQEESHLYRDAGDGAAALAGLTLLPLGRGRVCFEPRELEAAAALLEDGKAPRGLGAISVESPVRRLEGRHLGYARWARLVGAARRLGAKVHLDGARLLLAAAATGVPARLYAALADTVYVSLYKYLGAPAGAMLAGPGPVIEDVRRERRVFGGALPEAAFIAAPVLARLDGFPERFGAALRRGRALWAGLRGVRGLSVETFPDGTNIALLRVRRPRPALFRARLRRAGVELGRFDAARGVFYLQVNETILDAAPGALLAAFREAAK